MHKDIAWLQRDMHGWVANWNPKHALLFQAAHAHFLPSNQILPRLQILQKDSGTRVTSCIVAFVALSLLPVQLEVTKGSWLPTLTRDKIKTVTACSTCPAGCWSCVQKRCKESLLQVLLRSVLKNKMHSQLLTSFFPLQPLCAFAKISTQ